jgi:uncharacterized protein YxjI
VLRRMTHRDDGPPTGPSRYQMRERLISIGGDYNVEDEHGQRAFHIDGKALRLRHTMKFQDAQGRDIYTIQERVVRVRDSMAIERDGQKVAEIHKALITPLRDRLTVNIEGGADMTVQGNLLDHEYEITQGSRMPIATISKKWFRVRDTYGVEVTPGQDDALILAITTCVDAMVQEN